MSIDFNFINCFVTNDAKESVPITIRYKYLGRISVLINLD